MAQIETQHQGETKQEDEVVFPNESKYACHLVIPESVSDKSKPVRVLIWGHGSEDTEDYEEIVTRSRNDARLIQEYCDKYNNDP